MYVCVHPWYLRKSDEVVRLHAVGVVASHEVHVYDGNHARSSERVASAPDCSAPVFSPTACVLSDLIYACGCGEAAFVVCFCFLGNIILPLHIFFKAVLTS